MSTLRLAAAAAALLVTAAHGTASAAPATPKRSLGQAYEQVYYGLYGWNVHVALNGGLVVGDRKISGWVGGNGVENRVDSDVELWGSGPTAGFHAVCRNDVHLTSELPTSWEVAALPAGGTLDCQATLDDGPVTHLVLAVALPQASCSKDAYHGDIACSYEGVYAG